MLNAECRTHETFYDENKRYELQPFISELLSYSQKFYFLFYILSKIQSARNSNAEYNAFGGDLLAYVSKRWDKAQCKEFQTIDVLKNFLVTLNCLFFYWFTI